MEKDFKIRIRGIYEYLAVIIFVLGTGSLYFQVLRMPLMALMLLGISLLFEFRFKGILKKNLIIMLAFTSFFIINAVINLENGFHYNDLIIWLVNSFFVVTLASKMSFEEFERKFIIVMAFEAVISMICFIWADVLGHNLLLPLLTTDSNSVNIYYLTPYYTVGWGNIPVFHRNAGLFWEPGAHQIFLNLALFLAINGSDKFHFRKNSYITIVLVLIVSVLTTQSTTGYLSLAVVLMSGVFKNSRIKHKWKLSIAMMLFLGVLLFIELQTGTISKKIEGISIGHGSGKTRLNDTIYGYLIAAHRPLFGYGIYAENISNLYLKYGIVNISNGMAAYATRVGYVAVIVILFMMWNNIRKKLSYGLINNLLFFMFILMSVNTEGVFMNLFMMIFLFKWEGELVAKPKMIR